MQNFLDSAIRLKYMHKKISFIFIILYIFQFVSLEAKSEDLDLSGNIIRIKNDLQEITIGEGLPYVLVDGKILYKDEKYYCNVDYEDIANHCNKIIARIDLKCKDCLYLFLIGLHLNRIGLTVRF